MTATGPRHHREAATTGDLDAAAAAVERECDDRRFLATYFLADQPVIVRRPGTQRNSRDLTHLRARAAHAGARSPPSTRAPASRGTSRAPARPRTP